MNAATTFDSTKEFLEEVLKSIRTGKTQLPDFQRGWVWDDEHIRSLLASVSLSFPIGAVMMLQAGGAHVRFKPRLVEGVSLAPPVEPDRLILDGQQRLTSLYQSLCTEKAVETKDTRGKAISRWYYISIAQALDPNIDREEAIVGIPEDRLLKNFRGQVVKDYSMASNTFADGLFPLSEVFDCSEWQAAYNEHWEYDRDRLKVFDTFRREVIKRFEQYQVPLIVLKKETPKEAVCLVFEKVNTGGVALNVFELLTATFAAENFNLRDDWADRQKRFRRFRLLEGTESTEFLQAISLLSTRDRRQKHIAQAGSLESAPGVSCKRKDILDLSLVDYQRWADPVEKGFEKAAKLLFSQKLFSPKDIPYRSQLTPLAAILAALGPEAENDTVRSKLIRWYWCGILGELYGGAIETRFTKDLMEMLEWIAGGPEPATVVDAHFAPARLLSLRTRNSAAYKGVYALLMRDGGLDFRSGEPIDVQSYFDDSIDVHHVFPKDWCRQHQISDNRCNSIVNKTAISAKTNRMIGGRTPSQYLQRLQTQTDIDDARLDRILVSHVIDLPSLRDDDFDRFFELREQALLGRIEAAIGKRLAMERTVPEADADAHASDASQEDESYVEDLEFQAV